MSNVTDSARRTSSRKKRQSFGTLRTLRSGRWQASYIGPDGQRHNAPITYDPGATGQKMAKNWLREQRVLIQKGQWKPPAAQKAPTFLEYAERYIVTRTTPSGDPLKPGTVESYRRLLAGPLAEFHDLKLTAITKQMVVDWRQDIIRSGRKTMSTVAYRFLKSILSDAVDRDLLEHNPCQVKNAGSVKSGKVVEPPRSIEELETIASAMHPRYRVLLLMSAWGGFRFGEATELRRKDIEVVRDEDGQVAHIIVSVERAVIHTVADGAIVGKPKSVAGTRKVFLPPVIFDDVVAHLDERVGRFPSSLLWESPTKPGEHLRQGSLWKAWVRARAAAGREDMPWHALRHFAATRFAMTGATTADVLARMGHTTLGVTMRYQHDTGRQADLVGLM